jgi:anti-anti-sigma factor
MQTSHVGSTTGNTPFVVSIEPRSSAVVVKISGSCSMMEATRLGEELQRVASKQPRLILLDMADLDFITSDGLGSIVAGYLRCRKYDGDIRLINPAAGIRQLLELTRLTNLFGVYGSVEEAMAVP